MGDFLLHNFHSYACIELMKASDTNSGESQAEIVLPGVSRNYGIHQDDNPV